MSLRRIMYVLALVLSLPAIGRACPGSLALGLPLLFGQEQPTTPWPATGTGATPIVDLELPAAFEEAEGPPARSQMAVECLKAWRQLIREGRFEQAAPVAAKAASLDPASLDAQHAVIVSQMLRAIGEQSRNSARTATCPLQSFSVMIGGLCGETCPKGMCCPIETAAKKKIEIEIVVPVNLDRFVTGGNSAIQLIAPLRHATLVKPATSATKPGDDVGAVKPANCDESTEDRAMAIKALRYLFPDGLASGSAPAPNPLPLVRETCSQDRLIPAVCSETISKGRVSVKAAGWLVECDRILSMNDREMILEGNVAMTMRGRDVAVQAGRVRVNLVEGTLQVDGK